MDEGHNNGGDGPEYVFLGDSGVIHVEKPSNWEGKPPKEVSREARLETERILKECDLYRTRMKIRNSLRRWYEKIPLVADLLHVPYLPEMTAQEVFDEHDKILKRRLAKATSSVGGGGYPAEALLLLSEEGNLDKDAVTLTAEEYAKQAACKFVWHVKYSGYGAAADCAIHILAKTNDAAAGGMVSELIGLKGAEILSDLIREKQADEAVKAFFELGKVCGFERDDFFDLKEEELRDPVVKEAFLRGLAGTVGEDATLDIYSRVRNHMEEVGFFGRKEADSSEEVSASAGKWLREAAEFHAAAYRDALETVEEAGFGGGMDKEKDRCKTLLVSRLIKMMRKSPGLYAEIRDSWISWLILEDDDVEGDRALATVFNGHLKRCFEQHPYLYNKLKHHWRSLGLHESGEEEASRRINANWASRIEFGDEGFDDGVIEDFEREKEQATMLAGEESAEASRLLAVFLMRCSEKKEEFLNKYPQYSDFE